MRHFPRKYRWIPTVRPMGRAGQVYRGGDNRRLDVDP